MTIAVMARAPVPGRCKTRLARVLGEVHASRFYEAMLRDTLASLATLTASRFVLMAAPEDDGPAVLAALAAPPWTIVPQRGNNLGRRFANSFADVFRAGDPMVLFMSDSPVLPIEALRVALAQPFPDRRLIAGPAEDGGFYAIGMTSLLLEVFDDVEMSVSSVMRQTRDRAAAIGADVIDLPPTYDVDEFADFERAVRDINANPARAPHAAAVIASIQPLP